MLREILEPPTDRETRVEEQSRTSLHYQPFVSSEWRLVRTPGVKCYALRVMQLVALGATTQLTSLFIPNFTSKSSRMDREARKKECEAHC